MLGTSRKRGKDKAQTLRLEPLIGIIASRGRKKGKRDRNLDNNRLSLTHSHISHVSIVDVHRGKKGK